MAVVIFFMMTGMIVLVGLGLIILTVRHHLLIYWNKLEQNSEKKEEQK